MKKIFAFVVCTIMLVCALFVPVFAEDESVAYVDTNVDAVDTLPTEEETATEGEITGEETMPDIMTELIVEYVKEHFEEISVIISLMLTAIYNIRKHKQLNRSISATNQNAITVTENSELAIRDMIEKMDKILFIDDGCLAAVGTHEQLYAGNAAYRKMVDLQKLEEEGGEANA